MGVGRHLRIVRHQDHRDPLGVELLEHPQDFDAGVRIEVAGRLVGQEQGGVVDQGPGDGHPLLLAARHLRRFVVARARPAPPAPAERRASCRASAAGRAGAARSPAA